MSLVKRQKLNPESESVPVPNETFCISASTGTVYSARCNPTGELIAAGCSENCITVYDNPLTTETPNKVQLAGHKNAVTSLRWSGDSKRLVSAGADKCVGIWDVNKTTKLRNLAEHTGVVNEAQFVMHQGLEYVVSCSDDGALKMWDLRARGAAASIDTKYPLLCLASTKDTVYTAGIDPCVAAVEIGSLGSGSLSYTLQTRHTDSVTSLSVHKNILMTNSMDNTVRFFDTQTQSARPTIFNVDHSGEMLAIRSQLVCLDNKRFAISGGAKNGYIWDYDQSKLLGKLERHRGAVMDVDVAIRGPDTYIVTCGVDGNIFVSKI